MNYRLYTDQGKGYQNDIITQELLALFKRMDDLILNQEVKAKYLVIYNDNKSDDPIFLAFGDCETKQEYERFKKKRLLMNIKRELLEHFKKEDETFLSLCASNRYATCRGCKYEYLCEELLKAEEKRFNDENNNTLKPPYQKKQPTDNKY